MANETFNYGTKLPDGQYEHHPSDLSGEIIRPYRDTVTHNTCGVATRMPSKCAETYQKNPKFYGSNFCIGCHDYFPVSQFKWDDGTALGE